MEGKIVGFRLNKMHIGHNLLTTLSMLKRTFRIGVIYVILIAVAIVMTKKSKTHMKLSQIKKISLFSIKFVLICHFNVIQRSQYAANQHQLVNHDPKNGTEA